MEINQRHVYRTLFHGDETSTFQQISAVRIVAFRSSEDQREAGARAAEVEFLVGEDQKVDVLWRAKVADIPAEPDVAAKRPGDLSPIA